MRFRGQCTTIPGKFIYRNFGFSAPPPKKIHNNLLPDVDFNVIYLAMYINFMLIVYKTDLMIGLLKLTPLQS